MQLAGSQKFTKTSKEFYSKLRKYNNATRKLTEIVKNREKCVKSMIKTATSGQ